MTEPVRTADHVDKSPRHRVVAAGIAGLIAMLTVAAALWVDVGRVGKTVTVIGAIVSIITVVAVLAQLREVRQQRSELHAQRAALELMRTELNRGAEASLRMLHFELLRLSINDPQLADVWPPFEPGLSPERNRQYLYANLIVQHFWLSLRLGGYTESQLQNALRNLFISPLMRDYWRASAKIRTTLVPGTPEFTFNELVDGICQEYESVLASAATAKARSS